MNDFTWEKLDEHLSVIIFLRLFDITVCKLSPDDDEHNLKYHFLYTLKSEAWKFFKK